MAKLYPNTIIKSNSNAEIRIFKIFQNFSDDFHIIHSLPWLSIFTANERNRYTPEGEIDFIVLHKDYGVLCIEIKGGIISYRKNAYFTNGSNRIKNPYEQIRDNHHWLRKNIIDNILIGYCVGFPDSKKPNGIDEQPRITFDINDLENLEDKIINIFQYWQQSIRKKIPTENNIKLILKRLLPESEDILNQKIFYDNKIWLTPSKEQSNIIEKALISNKFYIKGRAGTGKTILSIIMARYLLKEDSKILFLTFNKIVNKYIYNQFNSPNIDICTFHKFLSRNNRLEKNIIDEADFILNDIIQNISNKYDVLMIDEAQSFYMTWLDSLSKYFKDKKIYIFADSLQSFKNEGKVTDKAMNSIFHFEDEMILTKNYRSPRKVYERLLEMFNSSIQQVSSRDEDELDLIEEISESPLKAMKNKIDSLLKKDIASSDIVILISSLEKKNQQLFTYRDINIETVNKYRGMEKPIVIYMVKSADRIDLHELYIAYSRSTTQTIVIIPETILAKMKSQLRDILINSDFTNKNLKDEIIRKELEFKKELVSGFPNILKVKNIKIFFSDKYVLFVNKQYKFINTLIQDYLLKKEITYLEVSDYNHTQAIVYSSIYEKFSVEFELCENCGNKRFLQGKFCLQCNESEFKDINKIELNRDIDILLQPKKYTRLDRDKLNDSLKSLGRLFWIFKNKKIKFTDDTLKLLNHEDVMCISCTIEILIILVDYEEDTIISLNEIRSHNGIKKLNGLNNDNWVERTGIYIGRFITHNLFKKIDSTEKKYLINRNKIFYDK